MSDIKKEFDEKFDTNENINIERLARLSRLALSDEQKAESAKELKKMADYVYPRVKTEDASLPFSYCLANSELRADEASALSYEECKKILALAPSSSNGYITVPKIIREADEE